MSSVGDQAVRTVSDWPSDDPFVSEVTVTATIVITRPHASSVNLDFLVGRQVLLRPWSGARYDSDAGFTPPDMHTGGTVE
jgi:hypothetical protein